MRARLKSLKDEMRRRRHLSIDAQGEWVRDVVRGYFAYYAVPTNILAIAEFRTQIVCHWRRSLCRRSQRGRVNWERMNAIADAWIPRAKILYPWPEQRFDAETQGGSRMR